MTARHQIILVWAVINFQKPSCSSRKRTPGVKDKVFSVVDLCKTAASKHKTKGTNYQAAKSCYKSHVTINFLKILLLHKIKESTISKWKFYNHKHEQKNDKFTCFNEFLKCISAVISSR